MRRLIAFLYDNQDFRSQAASHLEALFKARVQRSPRLSESAMFPDADLLVTEFPGRSSESTLSAIRAWRDRVGLRPVILIATVSSVDGLIQALRCGVSDYLPIPVSMDQLARSVQRLLKIDGVKPEPAMLGASDAMKSTLKRIRCAAMSDANVLVTGETGTGKELVASAIHRGSRRADRPFICVNCAAIPDNLLESELFGHERGAFTGAYSAQEGKARLAHKGTLFLDEIGDMSLYAQAKILRVIDTHEIWALGGKRPVDVDIRIVAATNRNLEALAKTGAFRPDLFYRLNVARIHLPPLRERIEDLPVLLDYFVGRFSGRGDADRERFDDETICALQRYEWPGNIRELRNLVEALFVNQPPREIGLSHLPPQMCLALDEKTSSEERIRLIDALTFTNWNVTRAAQKLNWSRMTIYRKMTRYQIARTASARLTSVA